MRGYDVGVKEMLRRVMDLRPLPRCRGKAHPRRAVIIQEHVVGNIHSNRTHDVSIQTDGQRPRRIGYLSVMPSSICQKRERRRAAEGTLRISAILPSTPSVLYADMVVIRIIQWSFKFRRDVSVRIKFHRNAIGDPAIAHPVASVP